MRINTGSSSTRFDSTFDNTPNESTPTGTKIKTGAYALTAGASLIKGAAAGRAGDYNAKIAIQNAGLSRMQSIEEARRIRVMGRKVMGEQRANFGASGIAQSGSALDVLAETAANNELDALTIMHEGESRARMFESDARQEKEQGDDARTNSYLQAAGSLMSAGATYYGGGS